MTPYLLAQQKRAETQKRIDDFEKLYRPIIETWSNLLNDHMAAVNAENKAMLAELKLGPAQIR